MKTVKFLLVLQGTKEGRTLIDNIFTDSVKMISMIYTKCKNFYFCHGFHAGIITREDAEKCLDYDVQGIIVSNHGGRQLDGVPATVRNP